MRESEFQKKFIDKIKKAVPGCIALKNDAQYKQGIFDWSVINGPKVACLEIKVEQDAHHQPNQDYYIEQVNSKGGYGRFVYPENEKQILKEVVEFLNN